MEVWVLGSLVQGISVVTTCYNERETLSELISAIRTVLHSTQHEVIVVDDTSPDGSIEVAKQFADVAFSKRREGQTKGLAAGMRSAKYETIITIDSDLENDPKWILNLADKLTDFDMVVASRPELPRISERAFSKVYSRRLGVRDILSNYRAYRRKIIPLIAPTKGETFGAEFLIRASKAGLRVGEITVEASRRRKKPRIGNTLTANLRIFAALIRTLLI
jgi:glycosyltransferase involved in cell wall biosynthesis